MRGMEVFMYKEVKLREEIVRIPTYPIGKPNKNPMFLEKRVYQGSSGKVYPYPVVEKIYDEKVEQEYKMVFLENDFVEIWIMPELGGRIQRAYDKTNGYDFVYYNQVIKPALVGLSGPWISGGIEFNWPQHHRPNTYGEVEFSLKSNEDGSKSVFVSETDKMYGTKVTTSFTLFPDKAYLKIDSVLYNGTDLPQTFLWWANPAVAVNDYTQSIFPPDVHSVFDHGKRDVSTFPIATGTYYKVDYSVGVDISRYKNIPVPTSYMAHKSDFNFVGNYDYQKEAGLLHIANHHLSPGKKQWTWGNGDFGQAWDRNLTDEDGPYIELMTGVFTDNQPDFTWLNQNEEKTFTQYFMPYKKVGSVKNATIDAVINVDHVEENVNVCVYTTSEFKNAKLEVKLGDQVVLNEILDVSPVNVYSNVIKTNGIDGHITAVLKDAGGKVLVDYETLIEDEFDIPEPAKAIDEPFKLENNEDLFLAGMHLEQYRHATREPEDYYLEGLKRNPSDLRINNAYGSLLFRRGQIEKSVPYFRKAIETASRHNTRLYDGEPLLNLGIALFYQNKFKEAYDALYKACWSANSKSNAYYFLALIDCVNKNFDNALEHIEKCLATNYHNYNARNLKCTLLRKMNKFNAAKDFAHETKSFDEINHNTEFELLQLDKSKVEDFAKLLNYSYQNFINLSIKYAQAGFYEEAISVLDIISKYSKNPLISYYLGFYNYQLGNTDACSKYYEEAPQVNFDYCFPNSLYDQLVLKNVCEVIESDSKAFYLLGNILYDKKQYAEAIACWEKSTCLNPDFPTAYRNLSLAYFNKLNHEEKSRNALEKAFHIDKTDARVFFELDQLYKKLNVSKEERLRIFEENITLVHERDDLFVEYVTLLNLNGNYEVAIDKALNRNFHPWEGGEGKITSQYVNSKIELGKAYLESKEYDKAISCFLDSFEYPLNFAEGKLIGAQENNKNYYLACAYEFVGEKEKAEKHFTLASIGLDEPSSAMYYNDEPPETIFYKGLALKKLGKQIEANAVFNKLILYGNEHINDEVVIDYFAVSLPDFLVFEDDLDKKNQIHCLFMMGLGYIGLEDKNEAKLCFEKVLELDNAHLGVIIHQKDI